LLKINLIARNYHLDSELSKYINRKLGALDRYLPKEHQSGQMRVEIFRDPSGKQNNRYSCKAYLAVPASKLIAHASTVNPHAAVDIVEEKLKMQIKKYKQRYQPRRLGFKSWLKRFYPFRGK